MSNPPGDPPDPPGGPPAEHGGAPAGPVARSPEAEARHRRRLWRRRRRIIGLVVFVGVVVALGVIVANAVGGGDDNSDSAEQRTTTSAAVTTTTLPPAGPYKVTDGINVRAGPGSTFPVLGQIELGNTVTVVCVVDGESVNGPGGATTKWLRIGVLGPPSYVTAAYVATGADVTNPAVIGPCPPA